VFPTLAELSGTKAPSGLQIDGHSFAPLLRGKRHDPRQWVFVQLGDHRFVRDERWLLHDDGRVYDISRDPLEKRDARDTAGSAVAKLRNVLNSL
jgi:arylsulfatase A